MGLWVSGSVVLDVRLDDVYFSGQWFNHVSPPLVSNFVFYASGVDLFLA